MSVLPPLSRPRAVLRDLRAFLAEEQHYRWIGVALAVVMPTLLVAGFYVDSKRDPPPRRIVYVQSWPATRTDAEIIAQQKIDQRKLDAYRAERRRQFQKLARDLGIE